MTKLLTMRDETVRRLHCSAARTSRHCRAHRDVASTALTPDADAKRERAAAPIEATAPRQAGEPIMAIVSIKTQQVTFYDADGWILRAPVSTGTTGRETPAGVFAIAREGQGPPLEHV